MEPNTSVAILLFEHSWATAFRDAIGRAGGSLVTQAMVQPEELEELAEEVAAIR
jgi:hypothetical protein